MSAEAGRTGDVFIEVQRQRAIQSGIAEKSGQDPVIGQLYREDAKLSMLSTDAPSYEAYELLLYDALPEDLALDVQSDEIDIPDPDPIEFVPSITIPVEYDHDGQDGADPSERHSYEDYEPATEGCLTPRGGVFNGPSGKETYYNLPMQGIVRIMRRLGYSEDEWPYWVREDGAKMLGDYIIVAAALDIRPRGTIVPTSLGEGIVCDTGGFAKVNKYQLDLAMDW